MFNIYMIINIVVLAIVALVVLLKAKKGAKRGAYLQPIHLATVLVAAICAFLLTTVCCNILLSMFEGKDMAEVVSIIESNFKIPLDAETKEMLASFDAELIAYLLAIPLAFLSPAVFLIFYTVLGIVFGIIRSMIVKFCKVPHRVDTTGKTIGGVLGAVEGLLVVTLTLMPITAILNISVPLLKQIEAPDESVGQVIDGVVDVCEGPAIKLISFTGGDFIANELSTITVADCRINLAKELHVGTDFLSKMFEIMESAENGGEALDIDAILAGAVEALEQSDYLPILLSGGMHLIADSIDGIMPEAPADDQTAVLMTKLTDTIKVFLKETSKDTVVGDIKIFIKLYALLESNNVMDLIAENPNDAFAVLTKKDESGKTLLSKMIYTLNESARTAPIITTLNEISISVMLQGMGASGDNATAEVYEELKGGVNNVLGVTSEGKTEEEYKTELKGTLQTTINQTIDSIIKNQDNTEHVEKLEEIKDSLDDEVMTEVTDKVVEFFEQNPEIKDLNEVDDAALLDFVTSNFGDILQDMGVNVNGGNVTIPDGFTPPSGITPPSDTSPDGGNGSVPGTPESGTNTPENSTNTSEIGTKDTSAEKIEE